MCGGFSNGKQSVSSYHTLWLFLLQKRVDFGIDIEVVVYSVTALS